MNRELEQIAHAINALAEGLRVIANAASDWNDQMEKIENIEMELNELKRNFENHTHDFTGETDSPST